MSITKEAALSSKWMRYIACSLIAKPQYHYFPRPSDFEHSAVDILIHISTTMVHFTSCTTASLAAAALIGTTLAHPGEYHGPEELAAEIVKREAHTAHVARGLAQCLKSKKSRDLRATAKTRRFRKAESLRAKRGLPTSQCCCQG